ncbi:hypothetical protein FJTKL_15305 [Diaporthe vaccinii]|uniref:Adenosine deaminase domain-containing protein n=1 Tax=Diaporthe vaccinii TaxID=105482 RepID=A0ABR4E5B9_9PEZI
MRSKVIFPDKVASGLAECLRFKKRWPSWIAGFDLVGEEGMGKPLNSFVPELLQFRKDCALAGVGEIPLLFHCGETLESGSEADDNLLDALLLGSRRIGHGFSLARRPYLMERMKKAGVCVELCPISNEVLGLTPRVSGHAMYGILANNVSTPFVTHVDRRGCSRMKAGSWYRRAIEAAGGPHY